MSGVSSVSLNLRVDRLMGIVPNVDARIVGCLIVLHPEAVAEALDAIERDVAAKAVAS